MKSRSVTINHRFLFPAAPWNTYLSEKHGPNVGKYSMVSTGHIQVIYTVQCLVAAHLCPDSIGIVRLEC